MFAFGKPALSARRERERERKKDRQREKEKEREIEGESRKKQLFDLFRGNGLNFARL
jgi:ribosomal protein L12E/L44/L45/RPP1/RPP2